MANIDVQPQLTNAFYAQAVISFAVSVTGVSIGIAYLPAGPWVRGFLLLGLLYVVTSSLTLAKCVRDHHESQHVVQRVDQVRLEKFLTDHDPFKMPA